MQRSVLSRVVAITVEALIRYGLTIRERVEKRRY